MLNGCLQKCWAPYGLQKRKGDYVGRAGGGYLSSWNVWHSLTPMQRRHSMIIYDQKHLSVPLISYRLAHTFTFKSIPTQQGMSGNHFMNYLWERMKSLIVSLCLSHFDSDHWKHFKKNHAKITFYFKKISMISTYFSDDSKCSVKWHLDEALL